MSRATVQREIARIEATGRIRALSNGETIQLEKLIRTERQYRRTSESRTAAKAPALAAIACPTSIPIGVGNQVRFTVPTTAGPRTYEGRVVGFRANRGGPVGWVEVEDAAGFRRSIQPSRIEVLT